MFVTDIQYRVCVSLAREYGHGWGQLAVEPRPAQPLPPGASPREIEREEYYRAWRVAREEIAAAMATGAVPLELIERHGRLFVDEQLGGIDGPALDDRGRSVHRTGTGRTWWAVARDGSTEVEISRPDVAAREARWEAFASGRGPQPTSRETDCYVVLRGLVTAERGVVVDVVVPRYHDEHVEDLERALRAAGAEESSLDSALRPARLRALPSRRADTSTSEPCSSCGGTGRVPVVDLEVSTGGAGYLERRTGEMTECYCQAT